MRKASHDPNDPDKEVVGKGKPPKKYQFKPGESGNPKGRPTGCRNFRKVFEHVLDKEVLINGGVDTVPLSETSDWSVGTVWGAAGLDFYLLDVFRARLESPDLRRAIVTLHERHRAAATLIEETELGRALAQDLHRTGHLRAITLRPDRDKLARLLAQAARFEAGQVHLPENAPWLATYLNELLGFLNAPHDDQVDSTSQALNWLTARTPLDRPIVRQDLSAATLCGEISVGDDGEVARLRAMGIRDRPTAPQSPWQNAPPSSASFRAVGELAFRGSV